MRWRLLMVLTVGVLGAADRPPAGAVKEELNKFVGTWNMTSAVVNGRPRPKEELQPLTVVYSAEGTFVLKYKDRVVGKGRIKVDTAKDPRAVDLTYAEINESDGRFWPVVQVLGIYQFEGDTLRLCYSRVDKGKERPAEFTSKPGSKRVLEVLRRAKP